MLFVGLYSPVWGVTVSGSQVASVILVGDDELSLGGQETIDSEADQCDPEVTRSRTHSPMDV